MFLWFSVYCVRTILQPQTVSQIVCVCVCVCDFFKLVIGTQTQQYLINGLHREIERHKLTHRSESCLYTVQYAQCLVLSTPVRHG